MSRSSLIADERVSCWWDSRSIICPSCCLFSRKPAACRSRVTSRTCAVRCCRPSTTSFMFSISSGNDAVPFRRLRLSFSIRLCSSECRGTGSTTLSEPHPSIRSVSSSSVVSKGYSGKTSGVPYLTGVSFPVSFSCCRAGVTAESFGV